MFTNQQVIGYISVPACLPYVYIIIHIGPDDSWNKVPNKGYIGQVLLVHPENTAPGIKGYVTIQKYGFQARTPPVNNLPILCLIAYLSIGPFFGNSERPAIVMT